jgi:capsular polysaccharide biosynthesis protein
MSTTGAGWTRFARALVRRGVAVLAAVVLGVGGGYAAAHLSATSYSSTAVLLVPSGAGPAGPGAANDAEALAATYAAAIPQDAVVQDAAAAATGIPMSGVQADLDVTVESGSSLLDLRFTAPSAKAALAGLVAVVNAVAAAQPLTPAVGGGSLVTVHPPEPAAGSSPDRKKEIGLGGLLGLLVGAVAAFAWERADPRVDDLRDLRDELSCPCWPDEPAPAVASALVAAWRGREGAERPLVTLVPVGPVRAAGVERLTRALGGTGGDDAVTFRLLDLAGDPRRAQLAGAAGALPATGLPAGPQLVALIVARGARLDELRSTSGLLADLGQQARWAFLLRQRPPRHGTPPAGWPPPSRMAPAEPPVEPGAPDVGGATGRLPLDAGRLRAGGAYLLAAVAPVTAGFRRGFPLPDVNLSQVLIGVIGGLLLLTTPRHARLGWRLFDWLLLAFCTGWLGLGLVDAAGAHASLGLGPLESLLGPFQFLILYRALMGALGTAARRARALAVLLACSLPVDLLACLQQARIGFVQRFLATVTGGAVFQTAAYHFFARATGPFPHWTPLAGYLVVILLAALACRLSGAEMPLPPRALDAVIVLGALALVLTAELSAIAGALIGALLLGVWAGRARQVVKGLVVVGAVVALAAGTYIVQRLGIQFTGSAGSGRGALVPQTLSFRWQIWTAQYLPAIAQRLFTGWGPVVPSSISWPFPESQYIADLMAGGIPLLFVFGAELAALFGLGRAGRRSPGGARPALTQAVGAATAALALVIVPMAVVYPYLTSSGMPAALFVLAAMAAAACAERPAPATARRAARTPAAAFA